MNGKDGIVWCRDVRGNYFHNTLKLEDDKITSTDVFRLERGKTTLRGEHRKFKENKACGRPERLSCDRGVGFRRCKHMQYMKRGHYSSREDEWVCVYQKEKK